jgi:nicotinamidase-related amidase
MRHELQERGGNTVLLVIDVQNAVVEDGFDSQGVVDRVGMVVDAARASGLPIVYVQHEDEWMTPGSEGWHIRPEVAPLVGEPIVAKRYPDAFVETELVDTLASLGAGHLIITGAQSDACIRATSHRALMEGYDVTLVSDAHTTAEREFNGVTVTAEQNVAQVNAAAPWILYPGTTSSLATSDEVITSLAPADAALPVS